MCYKTIELVFNFRGKISSPEKFVLLALAKFWNENSQECYPTISRISDHTCLCRSSVKSCLKSLENEGFIAIVSRLNGKAFKSNKYKINLQKLEGVGQEMTYPPANLKYSIDSSDGRSGDDLGGRSGDDLGGRSGDDLGVGQEMTPNMLRDKERDICPIEEKSDGHKTKIAEQKNSACPYTEIIAAYHEILPELNKVKLSRWPNTSRAANLKRRWNEDTSFQHLSWWRRFFIVVRTNPHWMGENGGNWQANLGWLIKRENFDKVIDRGQSRK